MHLSNKMFHFIGFSFEIYSNYVYNDIYLYIPTYIMHNSIIESFIDYI